MASQQFRRARLLLVLIVVAAGVLATVGPILGRQPARFEGGPAPAELVASIGRSHEGLELSDCDFIEYPEEPPADLVAEWSWRVDGGRWQVLPFAGLDFRSVEVDGARGSNGVYEGRVGDGQIVVDSGYGRMESRPNVRVARTATFGVGWKRIDGAIAVGAVSSIALRPTTGGGGSATIAPELIVLEGLESDFGLQRPHASWFDPRSTSDLDGGLRVAWSASADDGATRVLEVRVSVSVEPLIQDARFQTMTINASLRGHPTAPIETREVRS
ncbi:hypothetical protein [Engelhardtia mirabilis]|uniref:Uncharacterized protein n=1 Tax=Engelhardtia mirabilis TaxID=2528011 RepID=A0A518BR85_9BACT|nr:hypothetical protein Pla133_45980 [Planctomycetes bacterium Pla133]QDV03804.1 hypothetical protein Pla86_45960 [Planctomycetes bacterium Pla86]